MQARREVQDVWEAFFADEERKDVVLQLNDDAETMAIKTSSGNSSMRSGASGSV